MMLVASAAMLAVSPAPACAFHDERGVVIESPNATPKFEAAGKPWFEKSEKIAHAGGTYSKYGLPRQLMPAEVEAASDYQGVPLFIEAGQYSDAPEIVYVMVRSAECSFQPYGRD